MVALSRAGRAASKNSSFSTLQKYGPSKSSGGRITRAPAAAASPFDSMLASFALTELVTAKVVRALGTTGQDRVAELEHAAARMHEHGPIADGASTEARGERISHRASEQEGTT